MKINLNKSLLLSLLILSSLVVTIYSLFNLVVNFHYKLSGIEVTGTIVEVSKRDRPRDLIKRHDYFGTAQYEVKGHLYKVSKIYITTSESDNSEEYVGRNISITYFKDSPEKGVPTPQTMDFVGMSVLSLLGMIITYVFIYYRRKQ